MLFCAQCTCGQIIKQVSLTPNWLCPLECTPENYFAFWKLFIPNVIRMPITAVLFSWRCWFCFKFFLIRTISRKCVWNFSAKSCWSLESMDYFCHSHEKYSLTHLLIAPGTVHRASCLMYLIKYISLCHKDWSLMQSFYFEWSVKMSCLMQNKRIIKSFSLFVDWLCMHLFFFFFCRLGLCVWGLGKVGVDGRDVWMFRIKISEWKSEDPGSGWEQQTQDEGDLTRALAGLPDAKCCKFSLQLPDLNDGCKLPSKQRKLKVQMLQNSKQTYLPLRSLKLFISSNVTPFHITPLTW